MSEIKSWRNATQRQINNMTFEEALQIIDNHLRSIDPKDTKWGPRPHFRHALELIRNKALKAYDAELSEKISHKYWLDTKTGEVYKTSSSAKIPDHYKEVSYTTYNDFQEQKIIEQNINSLNKT